MDNKVIDLAERMQEDILELYRVRFNEPYAQYVPRYALIRMFKEMDIRDCFDKDSSQSIVQRKAQTIERSEYNNMNTDGGLNFR